MTEGFVNRGIVLFGNELLMSGLIVALVGFLLMYGIIQCRFMQKWWRMRK